MSAAADEGAAVDRGVVDGGAIGRYQIVVIGKEGAVLLDTATGSSWSLARDIDTLQLGWRPLDGRWPSAVLHGVSERALPPFREEAGEASAAWWRPRRGSKWSRNRADAGPP